MYTASSIVNSNTEFKGKLQSINSPENDDSLGEIYLSDQKLVDEVIISSRNAFNYWKNLEFWRREELLIKICDKLSENVDEISKILSLEIAKPIKSAKDEVSRSIDYIKLTIESARNLNGQSIIGDRYNNYPRYKKLGIEIYEPLGVVVAISPFNYPINLAITKIAPALIMGNSVIWKPSIEGSLSAYLVAKIFNEILPNGVLNFVVGKSSDIGDYLVTHEGFDFLNFTGSTKVGKDIQSKLNTKSSYIRGMVAELGGKDSAILLPEVDLQLAINEIVKGAFSYSGQRCTAIKKVFIHESIFDVFMSNLEEAMSGIKTGNSSDDVHVCSLINDKSVELVKDLFNDAINNDMQSTSELKINNRLISPNILYINKSSQFTNYQNIRIFNEEQFAPILPIFSFANINEVIQSINNSEYGLGCDIFGTNISIVFDLVNHINTGTIQINAKSDRGPDGFPFSGIRGSGFGTQGVHDALLSVCRKKLVVINL